jgi:hypothetical protein
MADFVAAIMYPRVSWQVEELFFTEKGCSAHARRTVYNCNRYNGNWSSAFCTNVLEMVLERGGKLLLLNGVVPLVRARGAVRALKLYYRPSQHPVPS